MMLCADNPNNEKAEASGSQNLLARQVSLFGNFHASDRPHLKKKKEEKKQIAPDE